MKKVGSKRIQILMTRKIELRKKIKTCKDTNMKITLEESVNELEDEINKEMNNMNKETVEKFIEESQKGDGTFAHNKFWKLKQKLVPKENDQPAAKLDDKGNLITSEKSLKDLYLNTYKARLTHTLKHEHIEEIHEMKRELWDIRLKLLNDIKSEDWTNIEVKKAIDSLKNNKTRDPNGMINETIKEWEENSDLVVAITHLMNGIKHNQMLPDFMSLENITSIYKLKGSRLSLENDRGLFILTVFKKVLDKLLYFDLYNEVDKNMSDSNIGARKNQNVRNHLFIIYGIVNAVVKEKKESVHLKIYDLVKAFDSLELEETSNDLYTTIDEDKRNDKIFLTVLY